MEWFTANAFWVVIFIAFVAIHLFGHGGHGGHGDHGGANRRVSKDDSATYEGRGAV